MLASVICPLGLRMSRLPPAEEIATSSPPESLGISGRAKASAALKTADALCRDPGSTRGPSDLQSDALPPELSRLLDPKWWWHHNVARCVCAAMGALGTEARALRARSGCDAATPLARTS